MFKGVYLLSDGSICNGNIINQQINGAVDGHRRALGKGHHLKKKHSGNPKGCTLRATEALRWLSMSRFRCIERVSCSVGTLC